MVSIHLFLQIKNRRQRRVSASANHILETTKQSQSSESAACHLPLIREAISNAMREMKDEFSAKLEKIDCTLQAFDGRIKSFENQLSQKFETELKKELKKLTDVIVEKANEFGEVWTKFGQLKSTSMQSSSLQNISMPTRFAENDFSAPYASEAFHPFAPEPVNTLENSADLTFAVGMAFSNSAATLATTTKNKETESINTTESIGATFDSLDDESVPGQDIETENFGARAENFSTPNSTAAKRPFKKRVSKTKRLRMSNSSTHECAVRCSTVNRTAVPPPADAGFCLGGGACNGISYSVSTVLYNRDREKPLTITASACK